MGFQTVKTQITKMGVTAAVAATCGVIGGLGGWVAMSVATELRADSDAYYIPYQGQLDLGGQPVDGPTQFVFSLYDSPDAEAPIWVSDTRQVQVSSGYFAVVLGDETDTTSIDASIMGRDALYVGMSIDGVALEGRQRLLGVPFAQHSAQGKIFVVDNQIRGLNGAKIDGHTEVQTLSASGAVTTQSTLNAAGKITGDGGADISGTSALSTVTVSNKLTVAGNDLNSKLVRFDQYSLDTSNSIDTGISTSTWTCAVGSTDFGHGDIQEADSGWLADSYTFKNSGTWWVRVAFRTHNSHDRRKAGVVCFRNNIVDFNSWF